MPGLKCRTGQIIEIVLQTKAQILTGGNLTGVIVKLAQVQCDVIRRQRTALVIERLTCICPRSNGQRAKGDDVGALRADIATVGDNIHLAGLRMAVSQIDSAAG
ncbi:Uncharacterised protein [Yersinia intermedia]|nr:Uncharacterised protein [Yersinia intermedia]